MNTITSIIEKIERAKELDFGTIFSESIELFKKTWVQGLLLQIFTIIVMIPLIIILYIPLIMMMIAQQESGYADPNAFNEFFAGMSVLYLIFVFVGILVLGTISLALNAGFFRIMKRLDHDEVITTSDFFHFVKGKHLSKIFILMLVSVLISTLVGFVAGILALPTFFLSFLIFLYLMVPMSFFTLIFAFNSELNVGDIVKASFKLGNKKWLISFGLYFVSYICVMILTMITCGLGSLFVTPFMYHPLYLVYKHVVGFEETYLIEEAENSVE